MVWEETIEIDFSQVLSGTPHGKNLGIPSLLEILQ